MNKVNFKKVVFGVSLGTVMALGSMSSAFAADINHPTAPAKTVQQQKSVAHTAPTTHPTPTAHTAPTTHPTPTAHPAPTTHPIAKHQPQVTLLTTDEANAIALTQYQGIVKDNELTKEYGKDVYVIVIHSNDGVDYTVNVDARTGEVL
jgi:uncharacterized membrane protein YkoI